MNLLYDKINLIQELQEKLASDKDAPLTDERLLLLTLAEVFVDLTSFFAGQEPVTSPSASSNTGGYSCPNCNSIIDIKAADIDGEDFVVCPLCNTPLIIATNQ